MGCCPIRSVSVEVLLLPRINLYKDPSNVGDLPTFLSSRDSTFVEGDKPAEPV